MPITKLPVVHKFGIISQSQRLELQERLLHQTYVKSEESRKALSLAKNPFEVTEDFVQTYNDEADDTPKKETLTALAYKMLERIKRRAGLKDGGVGSHVDLPIAWTELVQLAQCKGKLQEDCLDVLITSLEQAPLQTTQIAALFYLAETTLYWLRTESIIQPYLRTAEIKLLHMGKNVFFRLFYHHMSGHLQDQDDFKNRLYTYLDGFVESQEAYSPYPNALLCMRYIIEVGRMVIGDSNEEAGEIKESDNLLAGRSEENLHTETESTQLFQQKHVETDEKSSHSGALSSSVHDLSPTLWHALDTWRCLKHNSAGVPEALHSLATCGMGLASESWVDAMCAICILGDASKQNLLVLKVLQGLAMGMKPRSTNPPRSDASYSQQDFDPGKMESPHQHDQVVPQQSKTAGALSDIYEKSEEYVSTSSEKPMDANTSHSHTSKDNDKNKDAVSTSLAMDHIARCSPNDLSEEKLESHSVASSVPTYTNAVFPETPGLHGWHWEVAVSYTDALADICLYGATSKIQKTALVGNNTDISLIHRKTQPVCPLPSACLLDLVYFKGLHERYDGGADDWSWRVRYSAIQGLVKICRSTVGDVTKEGLRTVAWNTLIKAHSLERDTRVLEALKVGQVESNIENLVSKHIAANPSTIGAKVAEGLALLYLPALRPPVISKNIQKPPAKKVTQAPLKTTKKPLRTTLQEEILIASALYEPPVSYETRTDFDLNRIVEDQWRKQLQEQLAEEEIEHQKEMEEKQKAKEIAEKEREESRKAKLGSKYKGLAYNLNNIPSKSDS